MFANREAFVAGSMRTIEKGLPVCNVRGNCGKECSIRTYKIGNKVRITSKDKSISTVIDMNSDLYKVLSKYPRSSITVFFDNIYFKKTEKLEKFVKVVSRSNYDEFNETYTEELYDDLMWHYFSLGDINLKDEWSENEIEKKDTYYIIVNIFLSSEEYLISAADDFYAFNFKEYRSIYKLNGKRIWNPFFGIIDKNILDFGGPWY